ALLSLLLLIHSAHPCIHLLPLHDALPILPPPEASVWTHALLAAQLVDTGISASQIGRVLAELELRPHRVRGWLNRAEDEQFWARSEEHTSELQSRENLVCRLLLEKKNSKK